MVRETRPLHWDEICEKQNSQEKHSEIGEQEIVQWDTAETWMHCVIFNILLLIKSSWSALKSTDQWHDTKRQAHLH